MIIEKLGTIDDGQMSRLGKLDWSVARLITLSKDFEVLEIPLNHLNISYEYEKLTLREMVMHMEAVNNAELGYPIILDEDGMVMDGRHRIMKALLTKEKSIYAVRFDKNPSACVYREDG